MSGILTNTSAMVALQTLKSINADLSKTQSLISTGKNIGSAKDNAAIWAISKVMEADVAGFKGISDSLSLGQTTISVARQAAERVTDLLNQMKEKIVSAQESNVDRVKIQTDISALREQISSVVGAAQFNGLNLLSNTSTVAGSGSVNVLSSLDRSDTGVKASDINVRKLDLSTKAQTLTGAAATTFAAVGAFTLNATKTGAITITPPTGAAGVVYSLGTIATGAVAPTGNYTTGVSTAVANIAKIAYVTRDGDTAADVAKGIAQAFNQYYADAGLSKDVLSVKADGGTLQLATAAPTSGTITLAVRLETINGVTTVGAGGGLGSLNKINVTTEAGANSALDGIEDMIQTAIDTAAAFGSLEGRINTQAKFISSLTDALKAGIGTLIEANMEEASARLQALQVQQQLGIQALSIANQAPQSLLALFRN